MSQPVGTRERQPEQSAGLYEESYAYYQLRDEQAAKGAVVLRSRDVEWEDARQGRLRHFPSPSGASAMLIDATRKWDYAPVGLPKKEFVEGALELWEKQGLPKLSLREP